MQETRPGRFTLVALLHVRPGREEAYVAFERRAQAAMAVHGGRIERRVRIAPDGDPARPDEVHLVTFPDRAAFDRYRQDAAGGGLVEERASVLRETVVWAGEELDPFGPDGA